MRWLEEAAPDAVDLLLEMLKDADPGVQGSAAFTLGHFRADPKRAVAALIGLLFDDIEQVRWSACVALGDMGNDAREAIGTLGVCVTDIDFKKA